ncbi:MAG: PKD domain-containing protein, partial [Cyclobacteriaceae bacterium]
PIAGQTEDSHLSGASRNVNATAIVTASLKTIEYPSGSKTTIEYEPNSFFDTISNDTVQGGGIRVKKLTVSDFEPGSEDLVSTYEYKQTGGVTSGKQIYRPVYALRDGTSIIRTADNQAPDGGILYSRTIVREQGRGSTVYEFLLPAMYPSVSYSSDWTASKSKIAREDHEVGFPCVGIGNQTVGYYSFPFAPSANYDFERGLIDKITTYAENATLVMERSFGYQRLSTTAVIVKAIKFDKVLTNFSNPASNFVYSPYQLITNVGKVMVTETTKTADEINPSNLIESVTSYAYSTVHKMLESVSSTNSDGIIYKTEYKYAKDFNVTAPDPTKPEVVAIKYLNDNFRHGSPVETINTRKEGTTTTTIGANLILYKDYGGNKVFPEKTLVFPQVAGYSATVVTGSSNQQLSIDSDYRDVGMVKSYTPEGLPISSSDNKKRKAGIHYGYGGSVPVAMVSNAWAEESVYDGFEAVSTFSLTASGTTSFTDGWTGSKALYVTSSNTLSRSGIEKASGKYILSFWVKPTTSGQMNYSCVGGSGVTGNIPYASASQWQYLEKVIDVSGVSSSFELQLTSSVAADVDEVKFYPAIATMSSSTIRPLMGLTSQTDDRGVSNFKEYDEIGREKAVLDRNKNTVQRTEYRYKKEIKPPLISNFTNDLSNGKIYIGDEVTFTAASNCIPVTYLWKVYYGTDSTTYTTSSIAHSFDSIGNYAVQLTVSSSSGTSTSTQSMNSLCVEPAEGTIKFGEVDVDIYECEANHTR